MPQVKTKKKRRTFRHVKINVFVSRSLHSVVVVAAAVIEKVKVLIQSFSFGSYKNTDSDPKSRSSFLVCFLLRPLRVLVHPAFCSRTEDWMHA